MNPSTPARRGPGERAGVEAAAVVAAARALYERDGLEALTMRGVAAELGVAPNTLYSHVPSKSHLIDALIDDLLGDIPLPRGRLEWREALFRLMSDSRVMLLSHAELMPQFLARPTRGRNALRLGEATLSQLARGGVHGQAAVDALRILLVYTLGFAAQEAPRRDDAAPAARRTASRRAFAGATGLERVQSLAERLAAHPDSATFETGLRWLIEGIATGPAAASLSPDDRS